MPVTLLVSSQPRQSSLERFSVPSNNVSGILGANANSKPPKPQPISATSTCFDIFPTLFSCVADASWFSLSSRTAYAGYNSAQSKAAGDSGYVRLWSEKGFAWALWRKNFFCGSFPSGTSPRFWRLVGGPTIAESCVDEGVCELLSMMASCWSKKEAPTFEMRGLQKLHCQAQDFIFCGYLPITCVYYRWYV